MGTEVFWVTIIKCINLLIGRKLMPVKDCIFDLYGLGCLLAMCKKTKSVISSCKIRLLPKRGRQ